MDGYKWSPIRPLSSEDRKIDLAAIRPLYESWWSAKAKLQKSSAESLATFNAKLIRSLSIETGILERIYELDRGTTEALIAQGFAEDLVSRSSTDIEPSKLIHILRDQEAAIQLVMDCVSSNRPLSKSVIHELHALLTRHQETTSAVDQFGNRLEIPLTKGVYKTHPNNPMRSDGSLHEYCPPVHVDTEMDNLLSWFAGYGSDDPIVVATWLHHRFTQIHPYQDGNGRVARALLTLVLLKAQLLPLVVDRDLRVEYIRSLELADTGDLSGLAQLFARLERNAILQALSVDADVEVARDRRLTSAVIDSLASKFELRKKEKDKELRAVNKLAIKLRHAARKAVENALTALKEPVSFVGEPEIHVLDGGPDRDNAHWHKFDVIKSSERAGKFINFSEEHYFIRATIRVATERLLFVVSFHHVGRQLSGIMEATSFARLESYEGEDDNEITSKEFFPCSLDPFVITWKTDESDVVDSFEKWLDAAIAVGIKEFGDRL